MGIKVLLTDQATGSSYIKEEEFELPLYSINEVVGYYEKEGDKESQESKIIRIEMSMFMLAGDKYQVYAYELNNGETITEEKIAYVL